MTPPRQVVAGRTFFLTRRCAHRRYLLGPSKHVRQVIEYCLGRYANKHGIVLHGYLFMGNHYHLLGTDPLGKLSHFLRDFHGQLARALNIHLGRWEDFWARRPANAPWLVTPADVLRMLVYLYANPTKDHLVDRIEHWPGVSSWLLHTKGHLGGHARTIERPRGFFDPDGDTPEFATLELAKPADFAHLDEHEWRQLVVDGVRAAEKTAAAERAKTGRRVFGRRNVLAVDPHDKPSTIEPRRQLAPHVICKDKPRRIEALQALKAFRAAYRAARNIFVDGDRDVVFPHGTWAFKLLGCNVAAPS